MRPSRRGLRLLDCLAVVAITVPANAAGMAAPCDNFAAARALLKAGAPDKARPIFEACLASRPRAVEAVWRSLLGLALSHELAKRPLDAATHFHAFLDASTATTNSRWLQRRADAARELERIEPVVLRTHALVRIQSTPPGAQIWLGGAMAKATWGEAVTPFVFYATPGAHALKLRLAGYEPATERIAALAGHRMAVDIRLTKVASKPPAPSKPEPPSKPLALLEKPASKPPQPVEPKASAGPWALIGVGTAALVAGGVVMGVMLGRVATYESLIPDSADKDVHARALGLADEIGVLEPTYITLYAVGAALLVGGIVWRALEEDGRDAPATKPQVTITGGPNGLGGFGAAVSGRF